MHLYIAMILKFLIFITEVLLIYKFFYKKMFEETHVINFPQKYFHKKHLISNIKAYFCCENAFVQNVEAQLNNTMTRLIH